MDKLVLLLFCAIFVLMTAMLAIKRCRMCIFLSGGKLNPLIRFFPPFIMGVLLLAFEAILLLACLPPDNRLLRSFVMTTRMLAVLNGLLWGVFNVKRPSHPAWWYGIGASTIVFTGIMLIPVMPFLQVILFLLAACFPIWPIYECLVILTYVLLVRGKCSRLIGKILGSDQEAVDSFLGKHRSLSLSVFLILMTFPFFLYGFFFLLTYMGWMQGMGPLR